MGALRPTSAVGVVMGSARSIGVLFARPLVGLRWTARQGPLAQKTPTLPAGPLAQNTPALLPCVRPATRPRLLARDGPILRDDVDPGLTRIEPDSLAACVAERKDIEDVGSRPGDVLALPIAEHRAVACSDE